MNKLQELLKRVCSSLVVGMLDSQLKDQGDSAPPESASPKPGKRRRAMPIIFAMAQHR